MARGNSQQTLRALPLFAELRPESLAKLAAASVPRSFAEAEHLINLDVHDKAMFVVQAGTVSVSLPVLGERVELARLGPGALLGEISLFCGVPHTADVVATSPVRALSIPHDAFWEAIKADAESLRAIIVMLARRVQSRTVPLAYLSFAAQALIEDRFDAEILTREEFQEGEIGHFARLFEALAGYVRQRTERLERAVEARSKDLLHEIARREQAERELRRLASIDPLTGALNRRRFIELAERELKRARRYGRPLSVLLFDIDNFKRINDKFGHAVGDEVLRSVVAAAEQSLRGHDIQGRLGGEEFVVVLPECTVEMAERVAERLRQAIAVTEVPVPSGMVAVTVSIGVTDGAPGEPLQSILERADRAMYAAKRAGRNQVRRVAPGSP